MLLEGAARVDAVDWSARLEAFIIH